MKGDDDIGFIPYGGIARLIITKLAQLIKTTGTQELELPSISQFCKTLQISPTGKNIHAVKLQSLALFGSHFILKETSDNRIQGAHFSFVDDFDVNGIRLKDELNANADLGNTNDNTIALFKRPRTEIDIDWHVNIAISAVFFEHIQKTCLPD